MICMSQISLESSFSIPGEGTFPSFVSVSLIDLLAMLALLSIITVLVAKYARFSLSTRRLLENGASHLGFSKLGKIFVSEFVNRVLLQRDLIRNHQRLRRVAHLSMFWGFVGLLVTTTLDYVFNEPGNYIQLFGGQLSPIRWLGNVSGAVMVFGALVTLGRMISVPKFRERVGFSDVWFATLLLAAGVSGFATEFLGDLARAANPSAPPAPAYSISMSASPLIIFPYGVHLVVIGLLLLSAPVSAFVHAFRVPSLRYLDRIAGALTEKQSSSDQRPAGVDSFKKIKEEIMIDEIKSHYENRTDGEDIEEDSS